MCSPTDSGSKHLARCQPPSSRRPSRVRQRQPSASCAALVGLGHVGRPRRVEAPPRQGGRSVRVFAPTGDVRGRAQPTRAAAAVSNRVPHSRPRPTSHADHPPRQAHVPLRPSAPRVPFEFKEKSVNADDTCHLSLDGASQLAFRMVLRGTTFSLQYYVFLRSFALPCCLLHVIANRIKVGNDKGLCAELLQTPAYFGVQEVVGSNPATPTDCK